jgi:UDP-N-acetylglucosamine 2-epimerase (non-hydrolysing)
LRPVAKALRDHGGFALRVLLTGQHRGLESRFDFLGTKNVCDLAVNPSEQSAGELREAIHDRLCRLLHRDEDDLVLVQGDTSSAYAGALAARDRGIALGHVEAGLRSFDLDQPWPEEGYRISIDRLSDLLFAPTPAAVRNLESEPEVTGSISLTGNTGIDALLEQAAELHPALPLPSPRKRILVTCHRRENRGEPMRRVIDACLRLVRDLPVEITFALHTSPLVRDPLQRLLKGQPYIRVVEPLSYREMVLAMTDAWLIMTDSGGIQEEAPALGRPVLVLREVTERSEALESRNAELVGTDPARIVNAVARMLVDEAHHGRMSRPSLPFGDGRAAARIVEAIAEFLARPPHERRRPAPLRQPCLASAIS